MVDEIIGSNVKNSILGYSLFVLMLFWGHRDACAQIGHGTKDPSKASVIEMKSDSKGLLIPRVALTSLTSFSPIQGEDPWNNEDKVNSLLVYNTNTNSEVTPGYYYWTTINVTLNQGRWNRLVNDSDIAALGLNVTADNGLTVSGGNNVQLGGSLTQNTTLTTTPDYNLTLATTTAGSDGKLLITGLDKTKVQATTNSGTTTGIVDHLLAVGSNNVVKALKAAMPKFFYMPSIIIPTTQTLFDDMLTDDGSSTIPGESFNAGTGVKLNLYARYAAQYGLGDATKTASSPGAPALPVLPKEELHYYVTWFDKTVFSNVSIDADGILTYTVINTNADAGSFMNIVFAVKE